MNALLMDEEEASTVGGFLRLTMTGPHYNLTVLLSRYHR